MRETKEQKRIREENERVAYEKKLDDEYERDLRNTLVECVPYIHETCFKFNKDGVFVIYINWYDDYDHIVSVELPFQSNGSWVALNALACLDGYIRSRKQAEEESRKRRELQESAKSKLTIEELEALGLK